MPLRLQAVTFRCHHRGAVGHAGTDAEGKRLASILERSRCRRCDPSTSPVFWFDRIALDALLATEKPQDTPATV